MVQRYVGVSLASLSMSRQQTYVNLLIDLLYVLLAVIRNGTALCWGFPGFSVDISAATYVYLLIYLLYVLLAVIQNGTALCWVSLASLSLSLQQTYVYLLIYLLYVLPAVYQNGTALCWGFPGFSVNVSAANICEFAN